MFLGRGQGGKKPFVEADAIAPEIGLDVLEFGWLQQKRNRRGMRKIADI